MHALRGPICLRMNEMLSKNGCFHVTPVAGEIPTTGARMEVGEEETGKWTARPRGSGLKVELELDTDQIVTAVKKVGRPGGG